MERRKQLAEYIAQNHNNRFEWGKYDCCLFVGRWAHKLGLPDYTKDFIGSYNDKKSAALKLREKGYNSVKDLVAKHLKPALKPLVGDIAYWKQANALGIVAGARYSYFADNVGGGVMAVQNSNLEFWSVE